MSILIAIIALSIIILIHELGHFFAAKSVGICVKEFSIFMGPKIFSKTIKGTVFSVRWIPIGGYVNLEGEEEDINSSTSFSNKKPIEKIWVIIAGPLMNILFALIVAGLLFLSSGYAKDVNTYMEPNMPAFQAGLEDGDKIISLDDTKILDPMDLTILMYANDGEEIEITYERNNKEYKAYTTPNLQGKTYLVNFTAKDDSTEISVIPEDSNGYIAGMRSGDVITSINGVEVTNRYDIKTAMAENKENLATITYLRNSIESTVTIEPVVRDSIEFYDLGIYYYYSDITFFESIKYSVNYCLSTVRSIYFSIVWLVTGVVSISEMMGPVGIVTTIGETVQQDSFRLAIISLLNIMTFISLNLGVMNLLPIPALDGNKILIYAIEGIRGKKFNVERTAIVSFVGLAALMILMLITTFNDILRIFGG